MKPQASCQKEQSLPLWASMLAMLMVMGMAVFAPPAKAGGEESPAEVALTEHNGKKEPIPLIQNRFFLKQNRFEFGPAFGYVPNNAFVVNPAGGLILAYHFSETLAAEGDILYGPEGGYKNLTTRLVQIAADSGNTSFQQPADRIALGALFSARWAPVYGKINLVGEGVLNFDLYGTAGLGMVLVTTKDYVINPDYNDTDPTSPPIVEKDSGVNAAHFALNLGIGFNFFVNQFIAIKLDARTTPYFGQGPDYGGDTPPENRVYAPFITSAGLAIFVPKMKPRLFNF